MCFLPRRALNVSDCEIARAYKVSGSSVEPIAFIVPRKADSFQSGTFTQLHASSEPSLSSREWCCVQWRTIDIYVVGTCTCTRTYTDTCACACTHCVHSRCVKI
ncbi:hypothetical protein EDD22DRAFT_322369 [Suillus occidentalis]|nr:hypothetical protein EDD22DRAFT_322369 [Suillus occidentalis]